MASFMLTVVACVAGFAVVYLAASSALRALAGEGVAHAAPAQARPAAYAGPMDALLSVRGAPAETARRK